MATQFFFFFFFVSYLSVDIMYSLQNHLQLVRADSLHNNTGRGASSIANSCSTVLPDLELVQQSDQYPASRAAESVSKGNGSTPRVHVGGLKTQDLCIGFDDGGKGLVEFPDRDVFFGKSGLLQELLDARGGCDGKINRIYMM